MTVRFPIEAGHIRLFAQALGDDNPAYGDPTSGAPADRVIAPPTFTEVQHHYDPDWPYRPRPGRPWFGSAAEPTGDPSHPNPSGGAGARVHAETHFTYHHPIHPGD